MHQKTLPSYQVHRGVCQHSGCGRLVDSEESGLTSIPTKYFFRKRTTKISRFPTSRYFNVKTFYHRIHEQTCHLTNPSNFYMDEGILNHCFAEVNNVFIRKYFNLAVISHRVNPTSYNIPIQPHIEFNRCHSYKIKRVWVSYR